MGVVDSGALRTTDLAKIGWLYLHHGWNVGWEADRVKRRGAVQQSLRLSMDGEEGFKYAFKWWLLPRTDRKRGTSGWLEALADGV
jgi:hypothetical protein